MHGCIFHVKVFRKCTTVLRGNGLNERMKLDYSFVYKCIFSDIEKSISSDIWRYYFNTVSIPFPHYRHLSDSYQYKLNIKKH